MMKYVVAALGLIAGLMGGVDLAAGACLRHIRFLVSFQLVAWFVAGMLYMWQRTWQNFILPMTVLTVAIFGATEVSAETIHAGVLTPPDKWSVMQWNPDAVSGAMTWMIALLIGVAIALAYHFGWNWLFRHRDSSWKSW